MDHLTDGGDTYRSNPANRAHWGSVIALIRPNPESLPASNTISTFTLEPSMKAALLTVLAMTGALAACSSKPVEALVGCYAMGGEGTPSLKIASADNDQFVLSVIHDGQWSESITLNELDKAGLQSLMGEAAANIEPKAGFSSADGSFKIIEVPAESALNGQQLDSPYLASFYFGSGMVYKKACPTA